MKTKSVYLDYAATTPVDDAVLRAMLPYFSQTFGNANSAHAYGASAALAVDTARRKIADCIGAKPNEIYFTSGGTEADNWAVLGAVHAENARGKHLIVSAVEHAAVLSSCRRLEKEGYTVTYLPVDEHGAVCVDDLRATLRDDTVLVSVMTANNEVGTLQPVKALAQAAHERGVPFHTDAVQAAGSIPIDVNGSGADMLSLSAHKFYGPKGVGVLYIRNGVWPASLLTGGHQERMRRGGTVNVPGAVGMAEALCAATERLTEHAAQVRALRDAFAARICREIDGVKLYGVGAPQLPQHVCASFAGVEKEALLFTLDLHGVACSAGAACASGSLEPSHVLSAMGVPPDEARGAVRFSLGKYTTQEDIDYAAMALQKSVAKLRETTTLFAERTDNIYNV